MKKTYIIPGMIMVRLQHQRLLMQSSLRGFNSNLAEEDAIGYGSESSNNTSGVRTKESSSIWDEEW